MLVRRHIPINMDYFDDLPQDAMAAFRELNSDTFPPTPALSPETRLILRSAKQEKKRLTKPSRRSNMTYLFEK